MVVQAPANAERAVGRLDMGSMTKKKALKLAGISAVTVFMLALLWLVDYNGYLELKSGNILSKSENPIMFKLIVWMFSGATVLIGIAGCWNVWNDRR